MTSFFSKKVSFQSSPTSSFYNHLLPQIEHDYTKILEESMNRNTNVMENGKVESHTFDYILPSDIPISKSTNNKETNKILNWEILEIVEALNFIKSNDSKDENILNRDAGGGVCYFLGLGMNIYICAMLHRFSACISINSLHGDNNDPSNSIFFTRSLAIWESTYRNQYGLETIIKFQDILDPFDAIHSCANGDIIFINRSSLESEKEELDILFSTLKDGSYLVVEEEKDRNDDSSSSNSSSSNHYFSIHDSVDIVHSFPSISRNTNILIVTRKQSNRKSNISENVKNYMNTKVEMDEKEDGGENNSNEIIKVVCISDTHGLHRKIPYVPNGDILIHGGDFSNSGEPNQIEDFMKWIHNQPHRIKIIIAGNHDLTIQQDYYENEGRHRFHPTLSRKSKRYDPIECRAYLTQYKDVIYLEDSMVTIDIPSKINVDKIYQINIYGSPWQPEFHRWAFNLKRGPEILEKWKLIPGNVNILITHGPPYGYGDQCNDGYRAGCQDLLHEIRNRIHPRLHIFGHIHEDAGVFIDEYVESARSTVYVNACTCNLRYQPCHPPIVINYPMNKSKSPYQGKAL